MKWEQARGPNLSKEEEEEWSIVKELWVVRDVKLDLINIYNSYLKHVFLW
jgi:hypothetical protein